MEMNIYKQLGLAVARRRKDLALTQADIAHEIGLTRASLANIETGRQKVLLHQAYSLAKALKFESLTELVPATIAMEQRPPKPIKYTGSPITPIQEAQLEKLIAKALK
jgi:DNA-binding XRE family transcriptional regulator